MKIKGYNIKEYDDTCVIRNTGMTTIRCPTPEHVDNRPSCYFNVRTGDWECKSCGATGDINDFCEHTGLELYIIEIDVDKQVYFSHEINIENLNLSTNDEYVLSRIKEDTIKTFNIRSDNERVYIPTNFGYVVRNKDKDATRKYLYFGKTKPYFTLNKYEYNKPLIIVEGIFGMLKLYELGYNSMVVFGTGNAYKFIKQEKSRLDLYTKVYTMFDNDVAGNRITTMANKYFGINKIKYKGDIDNLEILKV